MTSLDAHLTPWTGTALRHLPANSPFDVLDFRFAGMGAENRWNALGHPTLYLAGDEGVLIAEWGRHFAHNRTPALRGLTVERTVYALSLSLAALLDLRDPDGVASLSLEDAPRCFLDREIARATAHFLRTTTPAQAMLVPSMAFLDDLARWCLVVFLEKMPGPAGFVADVTPHGPVRWG